MSSQVETRPTIKAAAQLEAWRERALQITLIATLGAGAVPLLIVLTESFYSPYSRPAALSFLGIYLFLVPLLVFRRFDHRLRGWGLIMVGYTTGCVALARGGLVGSGRLYLLALPPIAIALVGFRAGIATALLSLFTYGVLAFITMQGRLDTLLPYPESILPASAWLTDGTSFAMLLILITLLLVVMVRTQARALMDTEQAMDELAAAHRRLLTVREEERKHVARDLHDTVLQQLFFVKQGLFRGQNHSEMVDLLDETIHMLRHTIKDQRPPLLDQGLRPALEELVEEMQKLVGTGEPTITWHSNVAGRLPLSDEQTTALYRIAQEALANALKHANAQHITVTLKEEGGGIKLSVADDGAGVPVLTPEKKRHHYGLTGMRERAVMINGQLRFTSASGMGTSVVVRIEM